MIYKCLVLFYEVSCLLHAPLCPSDTYSVNSSYHRNVHGCWKLQITRGERPGNVMWEYGYSTLFYPSKYLSDKLPFYTLQRNTHSNWKATSISPTSTSNFEFKFQIFNL